MRKILCFIRGHNPQHYAEYTINDKKVIISFGYCSCCEKRLIGIRDTDNLKYSFHLYYNSKLLNGSKV